MTESRKVILASLLKHDWFKNTDKEIKDELFNLSTDFDQFLQELSTRPDEIGELDVLRLTKLSFGNFLITTIFEVRSNFTNQVFTYEYCSWKTGSNPGARGVVFLETNGEISHFIVLKSHKFSTNSTEYDSVGGLYLRFYDNHLLNLPKKIENEIKFHLGIDNLEFKSIVDLGKVNPDHGMTNNQSSLFTATIDISHLPNLTTKDDFRQVHKPTGFELEIIRIEKLNDFIQNKINDSYYLSALMRCIANPNIKIPL